MEKKYEHIIKYEKTLDTFNKKIEELDHLLHFFEQHHSDFQELMDYYQSEKYQKDIKEDSKGKLPQHLKRGILSQDAIYDLYQAYYHSNVKLLECGARFFKQV